MKEKDYKRIKALIEEEVSKGNRETLLELKDFLLEQISLLRTERFDILNLDLEDFLTIKSYGVKFIRNDMVRAVQKIKKLNRMVLVFDTVGIGKEVLLKEKGVGTRTVGKFEHALNQFGYSLDIPLLDYQIEEFKIYQKNRQKV